MNLAARTAALAILMAVIGVFATAALGGVSWLVPVAIVGFVLFGAGVFYGQGLAAAVGLAAVASATAIATGTSLAAAALTAGIGVAASVTLVVADASWWLRRDPDVDPAVLRSLLGAMVPIWLLGAILGLGAVALASWAQAGLWLLPVALVAASGLVILATWVTRGRHRRHDPLADLRP
jgi:hypothetical protein